MSFCVWLTNSKYQLTWVIIGLCKSLIDGTETLTEMVVTVINEVLWNLSKKSYSEQVLEQLFSIISLKYNVYIFPIYRMDQWGKSYVVYMLLKLKLYDI